MIHARLSRIDLPALSGQAGIVSCHVLNLLPILMLLPFEFLLELFLVYLLILQLLMLIILLLVIVLLLIILLLLLLLILPLLLLVQCILLLLAHLIQRLCAARWWQPREHGIVWRRHRTQTLSGRTEIRSGVNQIRARYPVTLRHPRRAHDLLTAA